VADYNEKRCEKKADCAEFGSGAKREDSADENISALHCGCNLSTLPGSVCRRVGGALSLLSPQVYPA
jgi:hypothetical protein